MPGLQQAVCRADGICFTQRFKEHRNAVKSGRNTSNYAIHAPEHTPIWPHPRNNVDLAIPSKRSPPQHGRNILHLQRILQQQPLK